MSKHLSTRFSFSLRDCRGELRADVRLGSPRFSDCRGVGICAILLDGLPIEQLHCIDWCQAHISIDDPTGRLLLLFDRATVTERTFDYHFGSGYLKLQEPFRLPGAVIRKLNLAEDDYALLPGRYPILDAEDLLLVSCRMTTPAVRTLSVRSKAA